MTPRELVANESPNRIRDHFGRKANNYNPTRSLTKLTSQISQEYEDRFLVELVQNAYDAHPPGTRDGRVHVRLDESAEGEAVLYVANTGNAFTEANFRALTNPAQSSKPVGEGIGNKGIGFRSVLKVCDSPEIYSCGSCNLSGSDFDGFCFGFATDLQIREMVEDEDQYAIVDRDFSRYLLPVVATPTDRYLRELRALGMVTVVRLPLTITRAVDLAREQVHRLLEPTPPIALFLDRLRSITVEHIDSDGEQQTTQVDRLVKDVAGPGGGPILRWVETVGRRFLTTTRILTATEVRGVVGEAIGLGELDPSWAAWDTDVEVSLAVPASSGEQETDWPSAYTYLPMRVKAPLYAHLHAPFHTKMARLDLNEGSIFNSFLIGVAAELAADTIELLTTGLDLDLDLRTRQAAVADLLCWDSDHIVRLATALENLKFDFLSSPLIPARGPDGTTWSGLNTVRVWNSAGLDVLTNDAIEAHAQLLDQSIGHDRVLRLQKVSEHSLSHNLEPGDDEVADWIEKVAKGLQGAGVGKWNRFLSDIASVFDSRRPEAIHGRFILLDDKLKLRRSGPWRREDSHSPDPTVFLPPQPAAVSRKGGGDEDAELSTVPKNLQRAITFLHDGIKVRTRVGSSFKRTAVGELFKKADLVEEFELVAVLSHLRRLLAGKVSPTTHRQALSWVYAQEHASRANIADLAHLGLHVPTAAGWVPASQAVFSPGWDTPRASAIAALLKDSADVSASLQYLGERIIGAPEDWPFKLKDIDRFRDFLSRCGVRDGLFPVALRSATVIRMNGSNFTASVIANRFGFADHQDWAQHINEAWPGWLAGPNTPYTGIQELWIVPGQDAFQTLGAQAKDRLAAAILESIADWPEEAWIYQFRRRSQHHGNRPDPQVWPSPAKTFVERAGWFPMSDPGRREERYFVPLRDGWTFDETKNETAPNFARLAPIDHRRKLASSPLARDRLGKAGLMTWNSPGSAGPRLAELAALAVSGDLPEAGLLSVRRAAGRAWSDFVGLSPRTLPLDLTLVVSRGAVLGTLESSVSALPEVFVHDTTPGLGAHVLEASGFPILAADPPDGGAIADALSGNEGFQVRRTSTVDAKVILDGNEMIPSADTGEALLDVFEPWLVRILLAIVDLRTTRFGARITDKALHDAEARLRRMRLATGSIIELTVDNRTLSATGRLAECVHIDDPDDPLVVLNRMEVSVPSWRALEVLADDLAELIGQAQAASEIRVAALAFQRSDSEWREPSDAELAKVLRCSVEDVTAVLQNLRTSSDHLRFLLAPFIGVQADIKAARRIDTEAVGDLSELQALVAELIGDDQAVALITSAARAESIDGIRRATGTDLGALNMILSELGRPPLHFAESHRIALSNYLSEHRVSLLGALRQSFLALFKARSSLADYTTARDFRDVVPDLTWLHAHEVPTEPMMRELLRGWLATKGEPPPPMAKSLESVDQIRDANRAVLDDFLPKITRLISAWFTKLGSDAPDVWSDVHKVRAALSASGCLDFTEFDEQELLAWLAALDLWPGGMSVTVDASELGLSVADLEGASSSTSKSDEKRRRRRTELSFGNRTFDTATEELQELIEAVAASADDEFLRMRSVPTKLSAITPFGRRSGGMNTGVGGTPRSYGGPKPTQEQTAAIGLVGEVLAYRWLQHAYAETTPDSWVSANRTFQLGGHPGDDSLGYDFRIARKNETLYFEVKATTTGEYEFDIGESELRAARAARKGSFRIIFIRSILVPGERQLLILPNPLEPDVVTSFAQINQGMRLRFDPAAGRGG